MNQAFSGFHPKYSNCQFIQFIDTRPRIFQKHGYVWISWLWSMIIGKRKPFISWYNIMLVQPYLKVQDFPEFLSMKKKHAISQCHKTATAGNRGSVTSVGWCMNYMVIHGCDDSSDPYGNLPESPAAVGRARESDMAPPPSAVPKSATSYSAPFSGRSPGDAAALRQPSQASLESR